MPKAGDAVGVGEVGDRKLLEDGGEDVCGGECREVGVHGEECLSYNIKELAPL